MNPTLLAKARVLVGSWGAPPDGPALVALVLGLACVVVAARGRGRVLLGMPGPSGVPPLSTRRFLFATCLAAALLSVAYVAVYLRGGPRIVDATTYFLQGRALSEGHFTWSPGFPSASFRGRFLLAHDDGSAGEIGGIFPPGYPLLLALGFLVRAPLGVGPLTAAGLVVATWALARRIAHEVLEPADVEPAARLAALVSLVCAALRYHTADTMSHGATALAVTVAVERALATRFDARRRVVVAAGVAVGLATACRPFSGLAAAAVVVALLAGRDRAARRRLVFGAAGVLPGLLLLVLGQHAVTGAWLTSSQRAYYAVADGPPGCFRWGFGAGVGCLHEHGDFVEARLREGFGFVAAAGTTLRRLHLHLADVASFEPLALVALVAPLARRRMRGSRAVRAVLGLVVLHVLAYVPFYFDGSYPGGGARLFAELLPAEHALLAVAIFELSPRAHAIRAGWAVLALSLLGFAVHTSFEHGRLRDRDGGAPMFEPDALAIADVRNGLVFVDTDHGFSLGHDPDARAERAVVVARYRGDDRDRLLYERLGRPPAYRYVREPSVAGRLVPTLKPFAPPPSAPRAFRFEAEAEWPALALSGGLAVPAWTDACASGGRALLLVAQGESGAADATIAVPVPADGRYRVTLHLVRGAALPHAPAPTGAAQVAELELAEARWLLPSSSSIDACFTLEPENVALRAPEARLRMRTQGGPLALDMVELERVDEPAN